MTLRTKLQSKGGAARGASIIGTRLVASEDKAQLVDGERIVVCLPLSKPAPAPKG